MKKSNQWIFWAVSAYILFQFTWWAIYLIQVNEEILNLKMALAPDEEAEAAYMTVFERKKWMILGEGIVFLVLIGLGLWKVKHSLTKETMAAQQRENFMLSVTHELKSPLASIRLGLETINSRKLDASQQEMLLKVALAETDRLNGLTDNILLSSRMEEVLKDDVRMTISLGEALQDVVLHWPLKGEKDRITISINDRIDVSGDPTLLKAAIRNLLENAIKYSSEETAVEALVRTQHGVNFLEVKDQGIGIPEGEREKIFERFYRLGDERTRSSQGTGIGLFLVAQVAHSMGGSVHVLNNDPKGTIFRMAFN